MKQGESTNRIKKVESISDIQKEGSAQPVWVAMLGIDPGTANLATFGETKGLYVWVAARARNEAEFCDLIETEASSRGLSVNDIADVMLADVALKERPGADIDWKRLIASAIATHGLALDSTYFVYQQSEEESWR